MKNISLGLQQSQKLVISPQLQHAIKLLQLSNLELVEKIETELAENPFLEEMEDAGDDRKELAGDRSAEDDNFGSGNEKTALDRDIRNKDVSLDSSEDNYFEDSSDLGYIKKSTLESDSNSKQQFLENAFAVETSIYEHLLSQLRLLDISDEEYNIGEILVSSLDENGYFTMPLEEVAESVPCSVAQVEKVLEMVQNLDPPGVGGRDLKEVLLIQMLQSEAQNPLAEKVVRENLGLLERGKLKEIASKHGCSIEDIKKAVKFISQFEPIPARQFDMNKVKYVVPDIFVRRIDDGFVLSINDGILPSVRLNQTYKDLLQNEKLDEKTKDFFNNKYSEAKLLLFSLDKRKSTISKVVEQIIEHQKEYFEKGPQYLRPLVLKEIAERIEMHESTISRVTSNKYMESPWGIVSLKYFFSSGIRKSSGEMKSSRSIKEIIKEIILNESGDKVLSDNTIVKILSNQGIHIARRTVAKYRKSLKILPSFKRKDF